MANRRIAELLLLLKIELKTNGCAIGMCYTCLNLKSQGIFSTEDYGIMLAYLRDNRPKNLFSIHFFARLNCLYYKKTWVKPRLRWIDKHMLLNLID